MIRDSQQIEKNLTQNGVLKSDEVRNLLFSKSINAMKHEHLA